MSKISVAKSLSAFRRETQKEFNLGAFSVTLKRFTLTDPTIKARVEIIQRQARRMPAGVARELKADIKAFCEIALVSWTLKDDNGKDVPIESAPDVLYDSPEGQELYFNLMSLATSADAFDQIDDAAVDEEEVKNSK